MEKRKCSKAIRQWQHMVLSNSLKHGCLNLVPCWLNPPSPLGSTQANQMELAVQQMLQVMSNFCKFLQSQTVITEQQSVSCMVNKCKGLKETT